MKYNFSLPPPKKLEGTKQSKYLATSPPLCYRLGVDSPKAYGESSDINNTVKLHVEFGGREHPPP